MDIYRILYVDDEESLLEIGKLFLEASGNFTVTTALNATDAIRLLHQETFDAIVSDYQMPVMDGIQFLGEVRARFGPVPFILFTGRGREEIVIQALNSGADFYIQKGGEPYAQFAELAHKIKSAVSQKRAADLLRASEERYRNVVETQTEFIARFRPDGTHLFVNDAYCRYFGKTREEMVGHRLRPEVFHADCDRLRQFFATFTPDHPIDTIEHRIVLPDGRIRWHHWSDRAFFDDNGTITEFQSVGRDITEIRLDEEALRESEKRYRRLHESMTDAFVQTDMSGHIVETNKSFNEMLGYTGEELRRMTYPGLTPAKWHSFESEIVQTQILALGFSEVYEKEYRKKDGTVFPVELRTYLISDDNGQPAGMWAIVRDITDRKMAENALRKTNEELCASYEQITATEEELRQTIDDLGRTERFLRESEEKYRTVFENTGTATVLLEENMIISLANAEFAKLSGFSKDEIEGKKTWVDFVVPEDRDRMLAQHRLRRENHDKALTWYEFQFVPRSGDIRAIYLTIDIIPGTKKSVASLLDITGRKRADAEVTVVNRLYAVLSATNSAIVHIHDKKELLNEICRIVVDTGGFSMAWAGIANEKTHLIEPVGSAGHSEGYLDTIAISTDDTPRGRGPTGTAFRTGIFTVCNDIGSDPTMAPWRKGALERGYRSLAAFPFARTTAHAGVITFYASEPGFFTDRIIRLLDEQSGDISFALETLDHEEQRIAAEQDIKKSELRYRRLFETAQDAILILDGETGEVIDANPFILALLAYPLAYFIGKHLWELGFIRDKNLAKEAFAELKTKGYVRYENIPLERKDGVRVDVEFVSNSYQVGDRKIIQCNIRDITDRKRAEEKAKVHRTGNLN